MHTRQHTVANTPGGVKKVVLDDALQREDRAQELGRTRGCAKLRRGAVLHPGGQQALLRPPALVMRGLPHLESDVCGQWEVAMLDVFAEVFDVLRAACGTRAGRAVQERLF